MMWPALVVVHFLIVAVSPVLGALHFSCKSLTGVTIGNGVTSIGELEFYGCSNLTSVTIPAGVTSIEIYAFWNCINLTDVYFGGSEAQWNQIAIDSGNEQLLNAAIHYNS